MLQKLFRMSACKLNTTFENGILHTFASHFSNVPRRRRKRSNTWKVLKCGAGEGWRGSIGLIM
jgi:hypothetical protein